MPTAAYDVYLSFSGTDAEIADRITGALRTRGWKVFTRRELAAGEDFAARERDALAASRFLVVLMSSAYFVNTALNAELKSGLAREKSESRVMVLPLRIDESPIPPVLAGKIWIDLSTWTVQQAFESRIAELDRAIRQHSGTPLLEASAITVPVELLQSCTSGECVLFAGAGLSARSGVPLWNQFLFDLLEHATIENIIDSSYERTLQSALYEGERNAVADAIVQMYSNRRDRLQSFLKRYYPEVPVSRAHRLLQAIPFSAIITTNYDGLLEQTFPAYAQQGLFTARDAEPLLNALSQRRPFFLKLYGAVDRLETLLFAPMEYREVLSANISFSNFMEGILFSRTFFFVGLSLEGIHDFLSGFVFRGVSNRKHFALVAVAGSAWKAKADLLLRRYNIEVIPFPVSADFPEVDTFLEELQRSMPAIREGEPAHTAASPPAGLRKLILENIGSFERLEIDFPREQNWKIILGDNGVGKSTILKAIAVAIMGNDARSYAARLVRTGQTRGRITLYTERNPDPGYVTEIRTKDVLSEAEITSLPSRPMEAEGWLALAFSPLRVVTWAPSTGPQPIAGKGRPTSDDLLPLISGETDPRMDHLKQWIVNLDSVEKPSPGPTLSGHTGAVKSIAFLPDGRQLISGSFDGTIRFWDCWTGKSKAKIHAHDAGVNSIALSADGKVLASGSYDRKAKTWDLHNYLRSFEGSLSQILSVALDAGGSLLVTGSESGTVRTWWPSGEEKLRWTARGGGVWCLAMSPDDATVAAGSYAGIINLHRVQTGEVVREIEVGRGCVMALSWSPDGRQVICASKNGPVNVWDVNSGAMLREFSSTSTTAVAISQDGRIVAAGTESGEVKAWDAESGFELVNVKAHAQTVWSVALSSDSKLLASASQDGTIRLWNLPTSKPSGTQRETIRRLFDLLSVLTDRSDIEYLRVTSDFRVMVRTADAQAGIPIEALSQGMTSLFGWVGVLCQRLKETLEAPAQNPLPTDSYALVLIDELDAHMHPGWQRVLVNRLSKAFPNAQFIATTHSPLIVADLPPESIFVLRREDGEITWGLPNELKDIRGLRVDQILLSDVFGIEAVRGERIEQQQKRYLELALTADRSAEQESEYRQLAAQLDHYHVRPEQTREAQEAARLIEESLDRKVAGLADLDREKLVAEIRAQMLELKTPFRRESVRPKS